MKKLIIVVFCILSTILISGCWNQENNTTETNMTTDTLNIELNDSTVQQKKDSLVQCIAITKKGTQCERLVKYPDSLCFQHKK